MNIWQVGIASFVLLASVVAGSTAARAQDDTDVDPYEHCIIFPTNCSSGDIMVSNGSTDNEAWRCEN